MEVGGTIVRELEQDLNSPWAVVGIDEGHLNTWGGKRVSMG
jgi:hypothetical protein